MKGVIAYASQQPWIFFSTLRENILFGKPFQPQWYNRVIEACALDIVSFYIQCGSYFLSVYSNLTLVTNKASVSFGYPVYYVNLHKSDFSEQ